jgi:hypothetical protein
MSYTNEDLGTIDGAMQSKSSGEGIARLVRIGCEFENYVKSIQKANQTQCICSGFSFQIEGCCCEKANLQHLADKQLTELINKTEKTFNYKVKIKKG